MRDLNDLFFYVQVVDHQGFAPAGRVLGIPKSRLSQRIALLEERLQVRLIQRTTRRFVVTEIGQDFYRHCVAMLVEADAAEEMIGRSLAEPRGVVRMSCPPPLVQLQVGQMVAKFMAQNPRIQVHLESTNRRVDVVGEGFDIALRIRFPPLEDTDLVMRVLGDSTQLLVAHPELLANGSANLALGEIGNLPSVGLGPANREHTWSLIGPSGAVISIGHTPRLVTGDMVALHQAAMHGVGVAQLPEIMVRGDLSSGRLVEALPGWSPKSGVVHAVFPSRRGLLPSVRSLIDFLAKEFESQSRTEVAAISRRTRAPSQRGNTKHKKH
ncbi:MAG: LysR family transcriptional regulator [Ramlibacter sp.]|nr:LysR family transcriptional regulator [Ramlibacter sp.]